MASGLTWIRFTKNNKEKEVPTHVALDISNQKSQGFIVLDGPGGSAVEGTVQPAQTQKKSAAAGEDTISAPNANQAKELYEANKAGKSYAQLAKDLGIHYKAVEKIITEYKAENKIA
jgi:hypothetical protein